MIRKLIILGTLALGAAKLAADDHLIIQPGKYADEAMAVSVAITTAGPDQIRYQVDYLGKIPDDGTARAIGRAEASAVPVPIKRNGWAFCFEAPNMLWFYDGMERVSLWTINRDRGLVRMDSKVSTGGVGPLQLRNWIRKNER